MPRIGFNWQWTPETTVYGGWGLFGGGTPNVWISNSFSNDGVTVVQTDVNAFTDPDLASALVGVDGFDIPQNVLDRQRDAGAATARSTRSTRTSRSRRSTAGTSASRTRCPGTSR